MDINTFLDRIDKKLEKIEQQLDKVTGMFTEFEREGMSMRKELDELLNKMENKDGN